MYKKKGLYNFKGKYFLVFSRGEGVKFSVHLAEVFNEKEILLCMFAIKNYPVQYTKPSLCLLWYFHCEERILGNTGFLEICPRQNWTWNLYSSIARKLSFENKSVNKRSSCLSLYYLYYNILWKTDECLKKFSMKD